MNRIEVEIKQVLVSDGIILTDLQVANLQLSALMIESDHLPPWLETGNKVYAVFKESEVSLAKNLSGIISLRNRFPCTVHNINRGKLLSVITLQFETYTITSAITSRSVDSLGLKIGDQVLALVKANEVSLMQK